MTETRPSAREINEAIRYTCWAVFARPDARTSTAPITEQDALASAPAASRPAGTAVGTTASGLTAALETAEASLGDVVVRGWYDVSGLRPDADLMVWLHGPDAESLQGAIRTLRRALNDSKLGGVRLTWSAFALHRPAEFNKGHVPAFLSGKPAEKWLCVYPFVRSYEWYLLPEEERRQLLVEHGMLGREYPSVLSNTVAAFALGDWEWVLALESPGLHDLVDLMRALRSSGARRHVRVEVPFHTGRLIGRDEIAGVLS